MAWDAYRRREMGMIESARYMRKTCLFSFLGRDTPIRMLLYCDGGETTPYKIINVDLPAILSAIRGESPTNWGNLGEGRSPHEKAAAAALESMLGEGAIDRLFKWAKEAERMFPPPSPLPEWKW